MTKLMYNTVINIYVMRYLKLEPDRSFWVSKVIYRVFSSFYDNIWFYGYYLMIFNISTNVKMEKCFDEI